MKKRELRDQVSYSMLKLIMRYVEIDRKTQNFGTNVPIHNAEIHLISEIGHNPGIHVKGLAEQMGVSSPSISETLRKLEKKELVCKQTDANNLSRLSLYLTKKGELAHHEHKRYHKLLEDMSKDELANLPDEYVQAFVDFLDGMLVRLDGIESKL